MESKRSIIEDGREFKYLSWWCMLGVARLHLVYFRKSFQSHFDLEKCKSLIGVLQELEDLEELEELEEFEELDGLRELEALEEL